MKFTLSWLRDHLDTTASLDELLATLNRIGLEVEAVTDRGATLAPFRTARIVSAEQHPNADRLRVCMVDVGQEGAEPVQVVCGAPNARSGLSVIFAPPGAVIPASGAALHRRTGRRIMHRSSCEPKTITIRLRCWRFCSRSLTNRYLEQSLIREHSKQANQLEYPFR